jgi:hypothetical protein
LYLPDKVDYTSEMSPVEDQGEEGACCGFASDAMKQWQEKKDWRRFIDLSPRFIYEEARKIDSFPDWMREGTDLRSCMKVLHKFGVCTEVSCPYIPGKPIDPSKKAYLEAEKYRIKEYWSIPYEEMRGALVQTGPFVCGVNVCDNWFTKEVTQTGIIPLPDGSPPIGGHAICIVGYDDEAKLFKFKNSWGEDWGDKGYGYIPYEYMQNFCLNAWVSVDEVTNVLSTGR